MVCEPTPRLFIVILCACSRDMYPFSRHPPGGILTMLPTTHNGYVSHTGTPNPYLREKTGSIHFPESEPSTEIDKEAQRILSDSFRSFHRLGNSNQPSGFHVSVRSTHRLCRLHPVSSIYRMAHLDRLANPPCYPPSPFSTMVSRW